MSDTARRRVFQCCQWLLIVWAGISFLASFFAKLMGLMFIGLFGAPIALAALGAAVLAWARQSGERRRWFHVPLLFVWPLLVASIQITNWPMKLSFAASTPALDRLAERVAAGQMPPLPTRAGAYTIHAVEARPVSGGQAICLWTCPVKRGHIGFVQSPPGVTPHVNPWTHSQLSIR
jgi:hypothetical protein